MTVIPLLDLGGLPDSLRHGGVADIAAAWHSGHDAAMLIGFLHEAEQPKIFFRAMLLLTTGKRGHIIEGLYLKLRRVNRRRHLISGCTGRRKTQNRQRPEGRGRRRVVQSSFPAAQSDSSFAFLAGEHTIESYARILNRRAPVRLSTVKLSLSAEFSAALLDRAMGVLFTWSPDSRAYHATCRSLCLGKGAPGLFRGLDVGSSHGPRARQGLVKNAS